MELLPFAEHSSVDEDIPVNRIDKVSALVKLTVQWKRQIDKQEMNKIYENDIYFENEINPKAEDLSAVSNC